MGELIPLVAILCVFGIPLSAIWTGHRRKILEMQLQLRNQGDQFDLPHTGIWPGFRRMNRGMQSQVQNQAAQGLRAEIEALRAEVHQLRDTSTQYDLSFDSALQRMGSRVEGVERRVGEVEARTVAQSTTGR